MCLGRGEGGAEVGNEKGSPRGQWEGQETEGKATGQEVLETDMAGGCGDGVTGRQGVLLATLLAFVPVAPLGPAGLGGEKDAPGRVPVDHRTSFSSPSLPTAHEYPRWRHTTAQDENDLTSTPSTLNQTPSAPRPPQLCPPPTHMRTHTK